MPQPKPATEPVATLCPECKKNGTDSLVLYSYPPQCRHGHVFKVPRA